MPRVSQSPPIFNSYINNTANYLTAVSGGTANYVRLLVTDSEYNTWQNFRADWRDNLYPKYSDKKESRTTAIKDKVRKLMKDFTIFVRPILNRISGAPLVTIDDLEVFNIKAGVLRDDTRTTQTTPVDSMVLFSMIQIGGGIIKFHCRPTTDSKRASKFKGCDVEVRYKIVANTEPTPTEVLQLTEIANSTKAIFQLNLGTENQGKKISASVRWIVNSDPNRNGPWSGIASVIIS